MSIENNDTNEVALNPQTLNASERNTWIKFEEQSADNDGVITSECVATIEPSHSIQITNSSELTDTGNNDVQRNNNNRQSTQPSTHKLQDVSLKDLNNANEQINGCNHSATTNVYANGDVIVTLLPLNSSCSWITPAKFKAELVPEELMAQRLSLTVEDYVSAMQVLINDMRFNLYITLYKRILVIWIALGFVVLLTLLFSGVKGLALFAGGVLWLVINALGIFMTMWMKMKIYHLLEKCIAHVNSMLYKYNILIGVDDRGKVSCHKINLVFIYFDVTYCIKFLKDMIDDEQVSNTNNSSNRSEVLNSSKLDIDMSDIVIVGATHKTLSQKEKYAEKLLLRYSQRWVKDFIRRRIDLHLPLHTDASGANITPIPSNPRHCISSRCLCQFIEEHLKFKPLTQCNIRELFM